MTKLLTSLFLLTFLLNNLFSQDLKNLYFGEKVPGEEPRIFAPGFISTTNRIEGRGTFSPDGKEFYFTVSDPGFSNQKIFYTKKLNDNWIIPDTASFSLKYGNWEPFISNNGRKIYFTSNRNTDTIGNHKDFYCVERNDQEWSDPKILAAPINTQYTELFYTETKAGSLYFCSNRPGGKGHTDLYHATKEKDGNYIIDNMGKPINSKLYDWDPCIANDESFIIYAGVRLLKIFHQADLYVTFRNGEEWTKPKRLGRLINTKANEYGPFLSPDNKFLFFTRLGKGTNGDIYWVDIKIIETLMKN